MISITWRTDDGTRWGFGKGSNITPEEFDLNNWELKNAIEGLISDPAHPRQIASFTVVNGGMLITMDDGSTFGPLPMPVLVWRSRGNWQASTLYAVLDVFTVPDVGIFLVLIEHLSGFTFDPDAVEFGSGNPLYQKIFAFADPADDVETGITAAGTTQATATGLTKKQNYVDTDIDGFTSVRIELSLLVVGAHIYIANESMTDDLPCFPPVGVAFNGQSNDEAFSGGIPANTTAHFVVKSATNIRSVP